MLYKKNEKASALVLVMIVVMVIMAIGGSMTLLNISQTKTSNRLVAKEKCFAILQAGMSDALDRINKDDSISEIGSSANPVSYGPGIGQGGGSYYVDISPDTDPNNKKVFVVARLGDIEMSAIAIAEQKIGFVDENNIPGALTIDGNADKAKLKLPKLDEDEESLIISGIDTSGERDPVFGIAIDSDSPQTFQELVDEIQKNVKGKKLKEGTVTELRPGLSVVEGGTIDGRLPKELINADDKKKKEKDQNGDGKLDISVAEIEFKTLNEEFFDTLADVVSQRVFNDFIDGNKADSKFTKGDQINSNSSDWGSADNPRNIVIETPGDDTKGEKDKNLKEVEVKSNELRLEKGTNVVGHGTLVIFGKLNIEKGSSLTWNGDIILVGGKAKGKGKEAKLHNKKGQLTVNGNVILLGTGDKKGKAKFDSSTEDKDDEPDTTINGSLVALTGGADDKSKDKAEVKLKKGTNTINGLLGVMGNKVKVEFKGKNKKNHTNATSVDGVMSIVLPDGDKKEKLDIKIKGNTSITFNSVKARQAILGFKSTLLNLAFGEGGEDFQRKLTSYKMVNFTVASTGN